MIGMSRTIPNSNEDNWKPLLPPRSAPVKREEPENRSGKRKEGERRGKRREEIRGEGGGPGGGAATVVDLER